MYNVYGESVQSVYTGLDDQLIFDKSMPIAGVNNTLPPAEIDQTLVFDAQNRLSQRDGLNRPRPGIIKRIKATDATSSWDWSIHMTNGVFLCVSAGHWYTWDSRAKILTALTGGPAYAPGDFISGAMATDTVYMTNGHGMAKYKPGTGTGTGFGTVTTLPTQYPDAAYIIWGLGPRLYYVPPLSNIVVCSNILDPEVYDPTLANLIQLDPVTSDYITGIAIWQEQQLIVGRNGATYAVGSGIQVPIEQWTISDVSRVVGPVNHPSMTQVGLDVYFLSETGRGVYAVSQMPASEQLGVQSPVSLPIGRYIKRINWAAARTQARAIVWNDLYMLAVPMDNSESNNAILVYSIALGTWQGIWEPDSPIRSFSRDATNPTATYLLAARLDGTLAQWTYPQDAQWYDLELDGVTATEYDTSLITRSFTFSEEFNMVLPYNAKFTFLESEDDVTITAILDRQPTSIETVQTTSLGSVNLVIPSLPFNLGGTGYKIDAVALHKTGLCTELQFQLDGPGNWTVAKIFCSAFSVRSQSNI